MKPLKSNTVLLVLLTGFIISCGSIKTLLIDDFKAVDQKEVQGTYEWKMRGHYASIEVDASEKFKYKFSNSGYYGYRIGTYELKGALLILTSDSLFQETAIDRINGKEEFNESKDDAEFVFAVSEEGLHEKIDDDKIMKLPSLKKRK